MRIRKTKKVVSPSLLLPYFATCPVELRGLPRRIAGPPRPTYRRQADRPLVSRLSEKNHSRKNYVWL
jgi:hypothetical protein